MARYVTIARFEIVAQSRTELGGRWGGGRKTYKYVYFRWIQIGKVVRTAQGEGRFQTCTAFQVVVLKYFVFFSIIYQVVCIRKHAMAGRIVAIFLFKDILTLSTNLNEGKHE
jgi:hypothetical protein